MEFKNVLDFVKEEKDKQDKETIYQTVAKINDFILRILGNEISRNNVLLSELEKDPGNSVRICELLKGQNDRIRRLTIAIDYLTRSVKAARSFLREGCIDCDNCGTRAINIDFPVSMAAGKDIQYFCAACNAVWDSKEDKKTGKKKHKLVYYTEWNYSFNYFDRDKYREFIRNGGKEEPEDNSIAIHGTREQNRRHSLNILASQTFDTRSWYPQLPTTNKKLVLKTPGFKATAEDFKLAKLEQIKNKKNSYSEHIKAVYGAKSYEIPKRVAQSSIKGGTFRNK